MVAHQNAQNHHLFANYSSSDSRASPAFFGKRASARAAKMDSMWENRGGEFLAKLSFCAPRGSSRKFAAFLLKFHSRLEVLSVILRSAGSLFVVGR
jgi:hypothetical protein